MQLARRIVVLIFAVIQAALVGRILLDLGVLPAEGVLADYLVPLSDALAAPVAGLSAGLGGMMGGGGVPGVGGGVAGGMNPAMVAALIGWTIVEGLVLIVVRKFAAV
jgi:hypothetical protein